MKDTKKILMWIGIAMELASVIAIAKAASTDSSPTTGILLLAIGVVVMVIGMATKLKASETKS